MPEKERLIFAIISGVIMVWAMYGIGVSIFEPKNNIQRFKAFLSGLMWGVFAFVLILIAK